MSATCPLSYGYQYPCRVPSGIQAVYITSFGGTFSSGSTNVPYPSNGYPFTLDAISTSTSFQTFTLPNGATFTSVGYGSVVGVTGSGTPPITFYKFNQRLEQGSYLESGIYGENGSAGFSQKLEITLEGYDTATKNQIQILNKGSWSVIVLDQNNNYVLMGYQNPVLVTTADGGLGKTYNDGVKTTLTFESKSISQAPTVNPAVASYLALN